MADQLPQCVFTGAVLIEISRNHKGGEAHFSAKLTDTVRKKVQLDDLPDTLTDGKNTDAELIATQMVLKTNSESLAQYEFTVKAQRVAKFSLAKINREGTAKNRGKQTIVYFTVFFTDLNGLKILEEYMVNTGETPGVLTISYTEKPEQTVIKTAVEDDSKQQSLITQ